MRCSRDPMEKLLAGIQRELDRKNRIQRPDPRFYLDLDREAERELTNLPEPQVQFVLPPLPERR